MTPSTAGSTWSGWQYGKPAIGTAKALASAAAPRAVIRESHRREENHPGGDEDELDGYDDQDHSPDAARFGGDLRRPLGWSGDRINHEGSLRGWTKASADGTVYRTSQVLHASPGSSTLKERDG